eukprot:jgi/Astpho2/588/fgenesh1_pg.00013_%23_22_t
MDWVRRSFFLGAARDVASAPSNSLPTAEVPSAMQRPTGSTTGSYNIQTALKQGAYKRFYDAVWSVFGKSSSETADFKLPQVVVVGSESSGKSSLLENITKCEIFPRDRSQCTRAPIRFKLMQVASERDASINISYKGANYKPKSQQEVLAKVKQLMDGIPKDTIDDSAEIIISMVLCVVPATLDRLNNDMAVSMVIQANRQQDTILVLTKADKVLAGNAATFEDDIVKRVLGTAGKLIIHGLHVEMSTLKPTMTVAQAAQYEDVQFTAALEKLSVEYKASKPLIQQHLSTPSLIHSMDHGFQDFIGRKWRPTALDRFKPEKHKIAVELAALGKPVGNLTVSDVLHMAKLVGWVLGGAGGLQGAGLSIAAIGIGTDWAGLSG